jgi:hypothetical protein
VNRRVVLIDYSLDDAARELCSWPRTLASQRVILFGGIWRKPKEVRS